MNRQVTQFALCLAALLASPYVRAQDPFAQPGAAAPAPGAAEPAPAADPFGQAAPGVLPAARPAAKPPQTPVEEPLVIQQLRDSDPQTPDAILRAANAVLQFGRPDETKRYLAKFLAANFPEAELASVPDLVGSALLLRLAREEKVQPEGAQVAKLVQDAAYKQVTDPAEIEKAIASLSDPSPSAQVAALERLAKAGTQVVTPMLRVLADPARQSEHRAVRGALAELSASTEEPLLGAIDVPDEKLRAQVVAVLGRIRSSRAARHLVRPAVDPAVSRELREVATASLFKIMGQVPDRYEAEKYLNQEIQSLLAGRLPYEPDPDGLVEMWSWDEARREVTSRKLPTGDAALLLATRLAADLAALNPGSPEAQRMNLVTSLELAKVLGGLDQPLEVSEGSAVASALRGVPTATINAVMADAIKLGRIPAIIAAAEILGQAGDAEVLTSAGPSESPLALALRHPDRRVRHTAALAILKLKPQVAFPGASRTLDPLAQVLRTTGISRALIAHPRGEEAQTLVGFMNDLGLEGEAVYSGRRLAELATSGADFEFILISDAIDGPPVKDLVQWLRKDYRTARIPIGVMATTEALYELRYAFENDPLTTVFPRLHSTEVARTETEKVMALAGRNRIDPNERTEQARQALAALGEVAVSREGHTLWNILRHESALIDALDNPALSAGAAAVLGQLGTPKSQTALVDFASQNARSVAERQAAAAAFAAAVQVHGLNLTQQQIVTQFERYNASERQSPEAQAVLGSLLDAIEAPTAENEKAVTRSE